MFYAFIFGERVEEHGTGSGPVGNHHAVAAGTALPAARNPLLDDAAAEIGIDQPTARDRSPRVLSNRWAAKACRQPQRPAPASRRLRSARTPGSRDKRTAHECRSNPAHLCDA